MRSSGGRGELSKVVFTEFDDTSLAEYGWVAALALKFRLTAGSGRRCLPLYLTFRPVIGGSLQ